MIQNKWRTGLIIVLCWLSLLGLNGCGQDATKHYVAVITKSTESNFWKAVHAGANAASTEYNLSITFEGPEREEDYETQNTMIRKAISNGADVIIISAVDYNANAEAINEAADAGVKIIVIDSDVNSDKVQFRIGTDNFLAGKMAGEAAMDCDLETLHVGIVNYDVNSANGQQREAGFREVVAKDSRVQTITTINVVSTTEDAMNGTIQLLTEHPEINVIATFNEWTSLGVGWAVRSLDMAENTRVVAFDSNVVSVGMLETGEVDALIVQNPYAMGYLGIERAYNLLKGEKATESKVDTTTTLVTRDNMFDAEYQKILFLFD